MFVTASKVPTAEKAQQVPTDLYSPPSLTQSIASVFQGLSL